MKGELSFMKTKHVIVLPYQSSWKDAFHQIETELKKSLRDLYLSIEHVGSTSVVGLSAKPVIDIDVIIKRENFEQMKNRLNAIGYQHEGDLGIKDREAFKYLDKEHLMKHHLYVSPSDSDEYRRHIAFRDWLRNHPEDVRTYAKIKEEMALKFAKDIDSYIKGKEPVIQMIYAKIADSIDKK